MEGTFKGRREDFRLVTGAGNYTGDWSRPDQAYGHFLRADRAHAEIVSIDTSAARAIPGVLGVFTGADVAGFKNAQTMPVTGRNGVVLKIPRRPPLAHGRVRFVGETVALVVAETDAIAQDAAEAIVIDYRDLKPVIEPDEAFAAGAPLLHDDAPGNLAVEVEYGDVAATDAAMKSAHWTARLALDAQRISGNPMEPKACLVAYDAAADAYDVYAPTQGMGQIHSDVANAAGIELAKVRVRARDVGGGFGVRNEGYPEFLAVFHAARTLKRPVKWTGSRYESIVSDHHGRGAKMRGELALDADGNFLAIRVAWDVNVGAYCSNAGPFVNTMAAPRAMSVNLYRIPTLYGLHRLAFTNTTPTTAYRGAGRPNVAYLIERLVDEAARISGIDRIALRRRNLIAKKAFPYKVPLGMTYDSGDPAGLLASALEKADWKGFSARSRQSKKRGRLRGIGCAAFIEPSGSPAQERTVLKFDKTGHLLMYTMAGASGQGHETVLPEVVAKILGIDPEMATLRASDPEGPPLVGLGTFGSRGMLAYGNSFATGAHEMVRKGKELAAGLLEASVDDVSFDNGRYHVKGTDLSIPFTEVVKRHLGGEAHPLDTTAEIMAPMSFPSGVHISEVEVDPETGTIEILGYTAVDDCGTVLNHMLTEGQVQGGIMQGIGQAMGEHVVYDPDSGQLLTGTYMDYVMPRADDWKHASLHFHTTVSPTNALGVKGAGEAGATGSIPCLGNAVMHALGQAGVQHLDMPYTPARVWAALQAAKAR